MEADCSLLFLVLRSADAEEGVGRERENARELFLGDDDEDEDDDDGDDAFFYDDMDCGAQEEKGRRKKERPDQKGSSRLSRICRHF